MDVILDTSFSKIRDLWQEFFVGNVYKRMALWAQIILIILLSPFIVLAMCYTVNFSITFFAIYIFSIPARTLHRIISQDGKNTHFLTQMVIYLIGFPLVFLLYFVTALLLPPLFIFYFLTSVFAYIASLGGIKFSPLLDRDVNRDNVISDTKIQKRVYIPYIACTLISVILSISFYTSYQNNFDGDMYICFLIFLGISISLLLFGWAFMKIKYDTIEKTQNNNVEKEAFTNKEFSISNKKTVKILGSIAYLFALLGFIFINKFEILNNFYTYSEYLNFSSFYVFSFVTSCICIIALWIVASFKKTHKFSFIPTIIMALLSLLSILFVSLTSIKFVNAQTYAWEINNLVVLLYIVLIANIALSVAASITSFSKKD